MSGKFFYLCYANCADISTVASLHNLLSVDIHSANCLRPSVNHIFPGLGKLLLLLLDMVLSMHPFLDLQTHDITFKA